MLDVHPEAGKRLHRRALSLRDLVLVMRKDQVDAAGVNVNRGAIEQPKRHRGALDVPSRPALHPTAVPLRLAGPGRLPQNEIAGVVFGIFVDVDARTSVETIVIEASEAAIVRQRFDPEVD